MKKIFRTVLMSLLNGRTITVMAGPLTGLKLRLNNLIKLRNYFSPYEPDKQKAFSMFLQNQSVFFDIGANIGLHSYYVSKTHPEVKVIAFEPLPINASYIREAIARNNLDKIELVEEAISSSVGLSFFDERDNNSKGMLSKKESHLKVKTNTLDEYVFSTGVFPDVVKIDVEGAKGDVLEGASKLIKMRPPVFIIELHNPEQDTRVAALLIKQNYSIKRLNDDPHCGQNTLLEIKSKHTSWPDRDGVWGNIVAIPERSSSR